MMIVNPLPASPIRWPHTLVDGLLVIARVRNGDRIYGEVRTANDTIVQVTLVTQSGQPCGTKIYRKHEARAGLVIPRPDRNLCASCTRVAGGAWAARDGAEDASGAHVFTCGDCSGVHPRSGRYAFAGGHEPGRPAAISVAGHEDGQAGRSGQMRTKTFTR